jgi:2-keto-4-pentenoate hydratase/2-oxohepta-3-ene-1,7-dioic acid hydratase in catechol pathway
MSMADYTNMLDWRVRRRDRQARARHPKENAWGYIAGYMVFNDVWRATSR